MTRVRAPQYLRQFRCIAERCEDTCCAGVAVPVSAEEVLRLRQAVPELGDGPLEVDGRLERGAHGGCVVLDTLGLCRAQLSGGEGALPSACAFFPRVLADAGGDEPELSGSLACPELARGLLFPEGALEIRVDEVPLPPGRPTAQPTSGPVREMLRKLWEAPASVEQRLAAMAVLAHGLGAGDFPIVPAPEVPAELLVGRALELLSGMDRSAGTSETFTLSLLRQSRASVSSSRFQAWSASVLEAYGVPLDPSLPLPDAGALHARAHASPASGASELRDEALRRLGHHLLGRLAWPEGPRVGRAVLGFIVQLAAMDVLLAAPRIAPPWPERAVASVQLFTKHLAGSELLRSVLDGWGSGPADEVLVRSLLFC